MSQTHIRTPKLQPGQNTAIGTTIVVIAVLGLIAEVLVIRWLNSNVVHVSTTGTVLETRIDSVGTGNSIYGGYIYYQIEARVQYRSDGGSEIRWMPASDLSTSRELLSARLASQPKSCYVAWEDKHPDSPRCEFVPTASLP